MKLSAPIFRLKQQAKLMARHEQIPLHEAQDRIAQTEGFQRWSHLMATHTETSIPSELKATLTPGALVLLAGRRYQGKTRVAFQMMAEALRAQQRCRYYSLEDTVADIDERWTAVGVSRPTKQLFAANTSDAISAEYIVGDCADQVSGVLIVIDYLQALDQQRSKPPLHEQVATLGKYARETGAAILVLSQIDRSFDPVSKPMPDKVDLRLPNPVDLAQFTATCFIHDNKLVVNRP